MSTKYQTVRHCKRCNWQSVVPDLAKGKTYNSSNNTGKVCPVCKSHKIRDKKERKQ